MFLDFLSVSFNSIKLLNILKYIYIPDWKNIVLKENFYQPSFDGSSIVAKHFILLEDISRSGGDALRITNTSGGFGLVLWHINHCSFLMSNQIYTYIRYIYDL